jgi:5-hydroxyisourate hydrolase
MPGFSIHVVDVSRGVVAAGMLVEVFFGNQKILSATTSAKGALEESAVLERGMYEAVFHVAEWYRKQKVALPSVPFLDVVSYRFGVDDSKQHYHLPFKCTPWGYSCFRGGA